MIDGSDPASIDYCLPEIGEGIDEVFAFGSQKQEYQHLYPIL
jgi:hypothetical protein